MSFTRDTSPPAATLASDSAPAKPPLTKDGKPVIPGGFFDPALFDSALFHIGNGTSFQIDMPPRAA